eukprot:11171299-Lingulodinium_polyedra.AAC.1
MKLSTVRNMRIFSLTNAGTCPARILNYARRARIRARERGNVKTWCCPANNALQTHSNAHPNDTRNA